MYTCSPRLLLALSTVVCTTGATRPRTMWSSPWTRVGHLLCVYACAVQCASEVLSQASHHVRVEFGTQSPLALQPLNKFAQAPISGRTKQLARPLHKICKATIPGLSPTATHKGGYSWCMPSPRRGLLRPTSCWWRPMRRVPDRNARRLQAARFISGTLCFFASSGVFKVDKRDILRPL